MSSKGITTFYNVLEVVRNQPNEVLEIVNGPGKWDLISGFANKCKVQFTCRVYEDTGVYQRTIEMFVTGLQYEDGSGERFFISFPLGTLQAYYDLRTCAGVFF